MKPARMVLPSCSPSHNLWIRTQTTSTSSNSRPFFSFDDVEQMSQAMHIDEASLDPFASQSKDGVTSSRKQYSNARDLLATESASSKLHPSWCCCICSPNVRIYASTHRELVDAQ
jgi:hypothetical protein